MTHICLDMSYSIRTDRDTKSDYASIFSPDLSGSGTCVGNGGGHGCEYFTHDDGLDDEDGSGFASGWGNADGHGYKT